VQLQLQQQTALVAGTFSHHIGVFLDLWEAFWWHPFDLSPPVTPHQLSIVIVLHFCMPQTTPLEPFFCTVSARLNQAKKRG
jgi:hypothetical protein